MRSRPSPVTWPLLVIFHCLLIHSMIKWISTLDILISKSTSGIAKNFSPTPDTQTPFHGPYLCEHVCINRPISMHITVQWTDRNFASRCYFPRFPGFLLTRKQKVSHPCHIQTCLQLGRSTFSTPGTTGIPSHWEVFNEICLITHWNMYLENTISQSFCFIYNFYEPNLPSI